MTMLNLISSTNNDSYISALVKTWNKVSSIQKMPTKSSFSEFRNKVSYRFFEDHFKEHLENINAKRATIRGFHIYAVDGDYLDIMPSKDLLKSGLRGTPCPGKKTETYCLKMYTTQAYDVVNGLIKKFEYSEEMGETELALKMIECYEKNSIAIYDRLYCGYRTMFAHITAGNKFIIRARFGGNGRNIQKEIFKFSKSKRKSKWIIWKPSFQSGGKQDIKVRLVKIKNPRTNEFMILMTNLTEKQFCDADLGELYQRRWDVEGSFRDITSTLKMEQWHSKNLNGILQEIFTLFWLINTIKFNCFRAHFNAQTWLKRKYKKSNFKFTLNTFVDNVELCFTSAGRKKIKNIIEACIWRTVESRERLSRSYPRVTRRRGRIYDKNNVVLIRP